MEPFQVKCKNQEEWSYILEVYGEKGYHWSGSSIPLHEHKGLSTFLKRDGKPHMDNIICIDKKECLISAIPRTGIPLYNFEDKFLSPREMTLLQARVIIYSD